ncbi:peptidoglycan editing factor PgeF [Candidatus Pelagibacter sp.]|nr:peptidoglycan editing factor PgeF [Candidatus Pelagibacter sp.]
MIKSKILNHFKNIEHGFFDKKGGKSSGIYKSLNCGAGSFDKKINIKKNLNIVLNKIKYKKKKLILLNQIHSNKFYYLKKNPKKRLKGDGILTNHRQLALGILTADCAPILFYDPKKKIIGAAHAGWRGAYKRITKKIINFYLKNGSNLKDIYVVIGPCISKKNYEVKNDFKKKFVKQNLNNKKYFKSKANKIFFSLKDYLAGQLKEFGIKNIEIIKKDTFNVKNNFFSARRSLKNKNNDYGRNISIIMIK